MTRPEERYLRQEVYRLKRTFPAPIMLCQFVSVEPDYNTGLIPQEQSVVVVPRAAMLPAKSSRMPGEAGKERPFTYGALYDSRLRTFIVSRRDIPAGFPVDNNMTVVNASRRYQVENIEEFGQEALAITCRWLENTTIPTTPTIYADNFSGQRRVITVLLANRTIQATESGFAFIWSSAGPGTITLPAWSKGLTYAFINNVTQTMNVATNGTDKIQTNGGSFSMATTAELASSIRLLADVTGIWIIEALRGSDWNFS